jgi:hypothetical protein
LISAPAEAIRPAIHDGKEGEQHNIAQKDNAVEAAAGAVCAQPGPPLAQQSVLGGDLWTPSGIFVQRGRPFGSRSSQIEVPTE